MVRTCGTPTAKGNVGNLLQHFVLVQVLEVLRESYPDSRLDFVAPYAMAPYSELPARQKQDCAFRRVFRAARAARLCGTYPTLLRNVTANRTGQYPSSALLVSTFWNDARLHLAEICASKGDAIGAKWPRVEPLRADWRSSSLP